MAFHACDAMTMISDLTDLLRFDYNSALEQSRNQTITLNSKRKQKLTLNLFAMHTWNRVRLANIWCRRRSITAVVR